MTFTQNSDLYVAVQDAGINRVLRHVMVQRPSLFNYGSILPATDPRPICRDIPVAPQVVAAGNPLITVTAPLPVIATNLKLDYIAQATRGAIDFFPGDAVSLPPELNPPLDDQTFAIQLAGCAGLVCQPRRRIWPPVRLPVRDRKREGGADIDCFCFDLFATGACGITGLAGHQRISMNVIGIEIPELKPDGLEEAIECYALLALNRGILPKVGDAISRIVFDAITLPKSLGSLTLSASTAVPHNPAIEENQIKAFVNLDAITLDIQVSPGGSSGGGGGTGGTVTRIVRPRTRTGTLDLTAAVSAGAFGEVFTAVVRGFRFSKSGSGAFGPFTATYDVAAHLEGGTFEMRDDGTIVITELDVKWDTLKLTIGINIPQFCVGGNEVCALPPWPSCDVPITGCAECVTLPSYCFFSGNPDIEIPIDLGGLITSEASFSARVRSFYGVGSGTYNRWQIVVVPTLPLDLDIIDIADTVGDLFKNLVQNQIENLLSSLGAPGWAIDLVDAFLGGIDNIIRVVLDIPDDIGEWILDGISQLGIFSGLLDALYQYLAFQLPGILEIEDPYPALPQEGVLIPVRIPIEFIGVTVNSREMVIEGDVGN